MRLFNFGHLLDSMLLAFRRSGLSGLIRDKIASQDVEDAAGFEVSRNSRYALLARDLVEVSVVQSC